MYQLSQFGLGQSFSEKLQSITNTDDFDKEVYRNVILKQLLSTDDDEEECNEAVFTEDIKGLDGKVDMEKNEVELKKFLNVLLKVDLKCKLLRSYFGRLK